MMQQSESLTGLQQVMEERSVQLFNQEERIHQRDDLLTKVRLESKRRRENDASLGQREPLGKRKQTGSHC